MEKFKVSSTTITITKSTTLNPERHYAGWMCVNQGTGAATVMGYRLQPGEGLNFLDTVKPGGYWDTSIAIICDAGAQVVFSRLQYMEF